MAFEEFKKYIVEKGGKGSKHTFFQLGINEISEIEDEIFLPKELKEFYTTIGYGYLHDDSKSFSINKFLSPEEYLKINLRKDYYEFDPTLDFYKLDKFKDLYIFFEVVEGNYVLIEKQENNGKNSIFYIDEKIADSLADFLLIFDNNPDFFG